LLLMGQTSNKLYVLVIYALLALAIVVAFEPLRHNDFVSYDDYSYVTQNSHITGGVRWQSVLWALTNPHYHMWHPLTSLSHMLDCQLFGLKPFRHHLTSLLIHIGSTLLLFWLLKKTTGAIWPSVFVAAAFGLHPLQVESVAWAAERKNVMSGLFWMLTIAAYIRYAARPGIGRYLFVFFVFALCIMTKPTVVTLPFVLLLLDYWPLDRIQGGSKVTKIAPTSKSEARYQKSSIRRLIAEKVPLFGLSVLLSVITFIVQKKGGAVLEMERLPLSWRIANAIVSYIRYLGKMTYPRDLAVFYPHPANRLPSWQVIVCFVALAAVSAVVIYAASRRRYLMAGWLWYLGTLVPVIGLVQSGSQAMADRYAYLPLIGIYIMLAWGAAEITGRWQYRKIAAGILMTILCAAMIILTRTQMGYWKDNLTLFKHTLAVTEDNTIMLNSFGCALSENNQDDEAIAKFKQTLRINPNFYLARHNLGKVFFKQGKFSEAIVSFNEALRVRQDLPDVYYYLGMAYARSGKPELAVSNYNKALHLKPDYPETHYRMGLALTEQGQYDSAIDHFNKALQAKPDWPEVYEQLGQAYLLIKKYDQAISCWTRAVQLKPDSAEVYNNLGWVLATAGKNELRNPAQAIKFAQKACELTKDSSPDFLDTLAVAYAADGKFSQAIKTAEKAIELCQASGNKELAEGIQKRVQLYKSGQPYREK
jgi:tetratricopeptide (TPR) repeat protein